MNLMFRAAVLLTILFVVPRVSYGQALPVLHVKVVLVDPEGKTTPVPRHALLISDNPATALPRRVFTRADGTADVSLRPGNYTVESDRAVAFHGKAYQWTQIVDIAPGRDAALELTADNADVSPVTSADASAAADAGAAAPLEAEPSALLMQWRDSVVALWTPTTRASGTIIDARGLIATNQGVIGSATSIEVQLAPDVKVAARVLLSDAARDVAVLWIDPKVVASVRPLAMGCAQPVKPAVTAGQEIFTIGVPLRQQKGVTSGNVNRVDARAIKSDLDLATGSAGGPVFTADGSVVGITSDLDEEGERSRGDSRIVRIDRVCEVVASAETKMSESKPPSATPLPVEPVRPFPVELLEKATAGRAGSLNPYEMASSDFDISFITPVLTFGAQQQAEKTRGRDGGAGARTTNAEPVFVRPLMDFSGWTDYVFDFPPVLLIRVTPKFVEGLWTKVARGAAQTQGVALPPIKRFKSDFSRMRAFCGAAEVTPIHPFKLEQRVSENKKIDEGLYAFDPGAFGPQCGTVKLVLYSAGEPEKGDTRVVDPKVLEQIWQDFAPYRALK